jgi:DNA-dependent protein kinase catalytic subunit
MAENALSSLEYWLKSIKLDKIKPYYWLVLNKFDDYLQLSKTISNTDEQESKISATLSKTNSKNSRLRKKLTNFVKNTNQNINIDTNSDLYEQIQFRILKIIGQLAGEMGHCMYQTTNNSSALQMITWDSVQHLKFYVPFVDMKPAIYFDRFLPRIIYLALSSTNRQVKVNSCELLHAIVIYMIGKSVSDPDAISATSGGNEGQKGNYQMNKIYNRIYPALLKLACDVDNFARNLFQPLVMQMIHWFTGNRKYESLDTIELLNCIMDCLVDEKDAALRDLSAQALKEFIKWSIKHTPLYNQDSASSSINVKSILKRIFNFLTHPSSSKRLGAALAWNSIYVIFREEESLVNKYVFELLYYLIESLAIAEKDDKMYGTQEHCKLGLDHVERIIRIKSELLNQRSSERVKPMGWSESVLEVAVRWLMRQCGRIETECRHKSMELVYKLIPCINGIKETREYFQLRLKTETEVYFLARFEGSTEKKEILKDSLCNFKTLEDLGVENFQITKIQTWLSMLTAPLDCYSWVFGERLLTPANLFSQNKSCIWHSLSYFIENIINYDLVDLIKKVYIQNGNKTLILCSPSEIEEYKKAKCTSLIRFIDFLCTMLGFYPGEAMKVIPSNIWSDSFFKCIVSICVDPLLVGFSMNDLEVFTNLPLKTKTFLKLFTQHTPPHIKDKLKRMCHAIINEHSQLKSLLANDDIKSEINKEDNLNQT